MRWLVPFAFYIGLLVLADVFHTDRLWSVAVGWIGHFVWGAFARAHDSTSQTNLRRRED